GVLEHVAQRVELDEDGRNTARVLARVDKHDLPVALLRPGASVSAKIQCGKRSLGFVWFHDLFEWFDREIVFRFF
ncbi:MAG: hypothetical protein N2C14_05705, partial [Planctomycetales bacterium]